jgi:hypothetical protein
MRRIDTPETFRLLISRKRLDPRFQGILHTLANVFAYHPADTKPLYFISTSDEAIDGLTNRHAIAAQYYETPWRTESTDGLLRIIHPAADVLVIPFSDYTRFLKHYIHHRRLGHHPNRTHPPRRQPTRPLPSRNTYRPPTHRLIF